MQNNELTKWLCDNVKVEKLVPLILAAQVLQHGTGGFLGQVCQSKRNGRAFIFGSQPDLVPGSNIQISLLII